MHVKRLSLGYLCMVAPMYYAWRLLFILLLAPHNASTGWLYAKLEPLLFETFEVVFFAYVLSMIGAKIHERRIRKRQEGEIR